MSILLILDHYTEMIDRLFRTRFRYNVVWIEVNTETPITVGLELPLDGILLTPCMKQREGPKNRKYNKNIETGNEMAL